MSDLLLFEDLNVGNRWVSPSKQVSREDAAQFAKITLDFNPLHLDDDFASESPFGRPIAHGLLGLSLVAGLASKCPNVETIALLGVYDWQFIRPVYYGDRIHVVSSVVQLDPAGRKRGRVVWDRCLVNQAGYTVQRGRFDTLVSRRLPVTRERAVEDHLEAITSLAARSPGSSE